VPNKYVTPDHKTGLGPEECRFDQAPVFDKPAPVLVSGVSRPAEECHIGETSMQIIPY
jgi:hypothetical protein